MRETVGLPLDMGPFITFHLTLYLASCTMTSLFLTPSSNSCLLSSGVCLIREEKKGILDIRLHRVYCIITEATRRMRGGDVGWTSEVEWKPRRETQKESGDAGEAKQGRKEGRKAGFSQ